MRLPQFFKPRCVMDLQPSNSLLRLLPARASAVELGIEKFMSL